MNFRVGIKPRYSILLIVGLALSLFPLIFSASIQAFRVAPENITADSLRQIADNDLWANGGLRQAISLAEDNYNSRGGYKSSAVVDLVPYEAMVTVASIGLQPEEGSTANDILPDFVGDVLYHRTYYRLTAYFSILPVALVLYCLVIAGATTFLILIPKARITSLQCPKT